MSAIKLSWSVQLRLSAATSGEVWRGIRRHREKTAELGPKIKMAAERGDTNGNGGRKKRGFERFRVPHSQLEQILKVQCKPTARWGDKAWCSRREAEKHYMKLDGQSEWSVAKRRRPQPKHTPGPPKP